MTAPLRGPVAPPTVLTVAEVAWRLQVSKMSVYRLIHDEELAAYKVGRLYRVPERGLSAYLERAQAAAGGGPS